MQVRLLVFWGEDGTQILLLGGILGIFCDIGTAISQPGSWNAILVGFVVQVNLSSNSYTDGKFYFRIVTSLEGLKH